MTVYSDLNLRRIHLHGFILSRVYRVAKKLILSRIIQIKLNQVKKIYITMCRSTCLPPVEGKKRDPGNEVGSSPWLGIAQERRGLSLFILGVFTHVMTRPRWRTKRWQIALKFCIIIASQIPKGLFTLFSNSPIEDLLTVLMLQSRKGVQINLTPRKNFICHDDHENIIT